MKKIELTPEWILAKLSMGWMVEGKSDGKCTLQVDLNDGMINAHLMDLAFLTLGINYTSETVGYDPDPEKAEAIEEYEFSIFDIQDECPSLFDEMYEQWEINKMKFEIL